MLRLFFLWNGKFVLISVFVRWLWWLMWMWWLFRYVLWLWVVVNRLFLFGL